MTVDIALLLFSPKSCLNLLKSFFIHQIIKIVKVESIFLILCAFFYFSLSLQQNSNTMTLKNTSPFFIIGLLILTTTCKPEPKNETKKAEEILQTATILSQPKELQSIFEKEGWNEYTLYQKIREKNIDFSVLLRFIRAVYHLPNENYEKKHTKKEWYLERLALSEFLQILFYYKQDYHKTFMDIGSGNGDKLYAAVCMGFEKAYGVEYEQKLHEVAQEALPNMVAQKRIEIQQGDATKLKPEYFNQADFIYMYCPLVLFKEKQAELAYSLIKNMRNNTLIYEAGFVYVPHLKKYINLPVEDGYRGMAAFKKENNKYYIKTFISHWEEFSLQKP
ncbi:MAG: class I SAM-dependent methyltransferase [Cytophagales bacterium]|nr:MAG: class I SAM-dependent methyltransferase [Cytophagales bacterium]